MDDQRTETGPHSGVGFLQNGDNQQLLRFCFAKSEATLEKAGEILRKL
jgi:hypothetical protein